MVSKTKALVAFLAFRQLWPVALAVRGQLWVDRSLREDESSFAVATSLGAGAASVSRQSLAATSAAAASAAVGAEGTVDSWRALAAANASTEDRHANGLYGTFVKVYYMSTRLGNFLSELSDYQSAKNMKLTRSLNLDMELLVELKDMLHKRLKVNKDGKPTSFVPLTSAKCLDSVTKTLAKIGAELHRMRLKTEQLFVSAQQRNGDEIVASFTQGGCDGVGSAAAPCATADESYNLGAGLLRDWRVAGGEGLDPHCRELPEQTPEEAIKECTAKCLSIPECEGFTWYNDGPDEGTVAKRCCFRTKTHCKYPQTGTACYERLRANALLRMDVEGVVAFLIETAQASVELQQAVRAAGLNGPAMSVLSRRGLETRLGITAKKATHLCCLADAMLVGAPLAVCEEDEGQGRYAEAYLTTKGLVEPWVFWSNKGFASSYLNFRWVSKVLLRSWKFVSSYTYEAVQAWAVPVVAYLNAFLEWQMNYQKASFLYDVGTGNQETFQLIEAADALAHLVKVFGLDPLLWGSCPRVHRMLNREDITAALDQNAPLDADE